jgi:hypothetical protein
MAFLVKNGADSATYFAVRGDGNVGIGTASPGFKLDVYADIGNYAARIYNDNGAAKGLYIYAKANDVGATPVLMCESAGASNIFVVNDTGNVGIGTASPTYRLSVVGSATDATPAIEVNNSSDATKITLNCNGTITADTSAWASAAGTTVVIDSNTFKLLSSSLRYKTEIQELSSEIDSSKIYDLHAVTFRYKTDDKRTLGYIAEEVNDIIPAVVHREAKGPNGEMVPESVAYSLLPVLIIEEMKKQQALIQALTERLNKLESKIAG